MASTSECYYCHISSRRASLSLNLLCVALPFKQQMREILIWFWASTLWEVLQPWWKIIPCSSWLWGMQIELETYSVSVISVVFPDISVEQVGSEQVVLCGTKISFSSPLLCFWMLLMPCKKQKTGFNIYLYGCHSIYRCGKLKSGS